MDIYLYNTMTRSKEKFESITENKVKMYTCGPTVYNFAHIGNFRAYVFEDFLRRTIEYYGYDVTQVMNLTDVDDKTIRDSQSAGMSLNDFTAQYKKAFFEDIDELNIERAEYYPAATDHIQWMIKLIRILMGKGFAYQADDGSVYYSISKFKEYGKLAKIDMKNQLSGVRINNDEYAKDSVADFALWKAWDEADGDVVWESPWGKGRPGWHIECSAMSMKYLGKTFDIHTGGIDNMFPHHEDEIAQSEAANGCKFVNYWMHNDYLIVDNTKMSKSLGNFFTIRDLLGKGYTGTEIRFVLILTHYRKKLNFTLEACDKARETLNKFKDFFSRLRDAKGNGVEDIDKTISAYKQSFKRAVGDDLNISEAMASVFGLQHEVNRLMDSDSLSAEDAEKVLEQYRDFNKVLGVFEVDAEEEEVPAEIVEMAHKRLEARKNKDFTTADAIRDQLTEAGWVVEDTAEGPRFKKV